MEVICTNCGASNRGTSRFCARCGEKLPLPEEGSGKPSETAVDLPWLQAVQEHAVQETVQLRNAPTDSVPSAGQLPAEQAPAAPQSSAQPPTSQPTPIRQGASAAPPVEQPAGQNPQAANVPQPQPPAEPQPDPNEPPPPWVVSILEPSVTPPANQGTDYEPEELAHIMPWMQDTPAPGASRGASSANPASPEGGGPSLPPWLRDVTVQESLQSTAANPIQAGSPSAEDDFALEGIEPFIPPAVDADDALHAPVQGKPAEQVPQWLRSIAGGTREQRASGSLPSEPLYSPEAATEPASIIAEPLVREMPVRAPRPGAVDTLTALLQADTANTPRRVATSVTPLPTAGPAASVRRGPARWLLPDGLIYISALVVLLAVLIVRPPFGDLPTTQNSEVTGFYNAIESVPQGKPVLVVYDWDATRSAEMSVLSESVMRHIMSRHLPFVTISTTPQGPGFAQQVIQSATEDKQANYGYTYGDQYLIMGYLPGNEAALRSAVDDFTTVLSRDYVQGRPLNNFPVLQGGTIKGAGNFALVVDLASDEAELRNWVEQVGARTQVPIVAAVPQSLEPLARTYNHVHGTGLKALITGTSGALMYGRQLVGAKRNTGSLNTEALTDRLNAQSVAQLLVSIVIVAAFISMATRRIFRRR